MAGFLIAVVAIIIIIFIIITTTILITLASKQVSESPMSLRWCGVAMPSCDRACCWQPVSMRCDNSGVARALPLRCCFG
jgi:hypothetical protein